MNFKSSLLTVKLISATTPHTNAPRGLSAMLVSTLFKVAIILPGCSFYERQFMTSFKLLTMLLKLLRRCFNVEWKGRGWGSLELFGQKVAIILPGRLFYERQFMTSFKLLTMLHSISWNKLCRYDIVSMYLCWLTTTVSDDASTRP